MSKPVVKTTEELVQPILEAKGLDLVDVEFIKEGPNWFLRVYIDKDGGVDIEECSEVSEALSEKLDEVDPIEQAYFLEVSSPGAERPLKNNNDIEKAVGKSVFIKTYEPIEGQKEFEGTLTHFDGDNVSIEVKLKQRVQAFEIPYEKIALIRLAVTF